MDKGSEGSGQQTKNQQISPGTMGRKSKALLARLNNISKASLKSYKATIEDAPDSDADDVNYISGPVNDDTDSDVDVDDACSDTDDEELNGIRGRFFALKDCVDLDSDLDSVSGDSDLEDRDLDEDEEAEIKNDAALLTFSAVLQQAQDTAAAAERKNMVRGKDRNAMQKTQAALFDNAP